MHAASSSSLNLCCKCECYASRIAHYQFKSFHKILLWSSMIKVNSNGYLLEILIVKYNNTQTNIQVKIKIFVLSLVLIHIWSLKIRYLVTPSFIFLTDTSFFWVIQSIWNTKSPSNFWKHFQFLISKVYVLFKFLTRRWNTHVWIIVIERWRNTLGRMHFQKQCFDIFKISRNFRNCYINL
jgi:hypothetical protein